MNKTQLIDALAARYEGNRKAAAHALDSVLDTITREVAKGEKVAITGFGSFEKRIREARTVRNPRTGETLQAEEKAIPKFTPGADLKAVISGAKKLPKLTLVVATAPARKAVDVAIEVAAKAQASKAQASRAQAAKGTTTKAGTPTAKAVPSTESAAGNQDAAKKRTAKKSPAKKAPAKKATAKKSPAKKTTAKKSPAKKAPVKKAAAKKTPATTAPTKKATAKKTSATKPANAKG